jgi:hypothetical protein
VILLVLSDYLNFSFTPEPYSHPSHQFHRRDREFFLSNPATDRVPTNAHDLSDFNRRMSSHLNNGIGLFDLSSKKRTRTGASLVRRSGSTKAYRRMYLSGALSPSVFSYAEASTPADVHNCRHFSMFFHFPSGVWCVFPGIRVCCVRFAWHLLDLATRHKSLTTAPSAQTAIRWTSRKCR